MKAVGYSESLPITDPRSLVDVELPDPKPAGRDLLVRVKAISVNPLDTKVRLNSAPPAGEIKVLGWDASGEVEAVGPDAQFYSPGDEVWYAGSLARPGTNSELHLVDEYIAARKPRSLDHAQAAALPLTSITAWELLFERLAVPLNKGFSCDRLLVVGAAGGVGSILMQLASRLTALMVIGTASRPETVEWVRSFDVDFVLDHGQPLSKELQRIGLSAVTHVASLTQTGLHYPELVKLLAPQGKLALIDDPGPIDTTLLKQKSLSLHWEFMFTRSMFATPDMIAQNRLLSEVAQLVDAGIIRSTISEHFGAINAKNLRRAHALIESGKAKGKIVLEGF